MSARDKNGGYREDPGSDIEVDYPRGCGLPHDWYDLGCPGEGEHQCGACEEWFCEEHLLDHGCDDLAEAIGAGGDDWRHKGVKPRKTPS